MQRILPDYLSTSLSWLLRIVAGWKHCTTAIVMVSCLAVLLVSCDSSSDVEIIRRSISRLLLVEVTSAQSSATMNTLRVLEQTTIVHSNSTWWFVLLATFRPLTFGGCLVLERHVQVFSFLRLFCCRFSLLVLSWACLEQIVTPRNVLESMAKDIGSCWWLPTSSSSNAVCAAKILVVWCNDAVLRKYDCLTSHWRSLVRCRADLHNLLEVWRQLN